MGLAVCISKHVAKVISLHKFCEIKYMNTAQLKIRVDDLELLQGHI